MIYERLPPVIQEMCKSYLHPIYFKTNWPTQLLIDLIDIGYEEQLKLDPISGRTSVKLANFIRQEYWWRNPAMDRLLSARYFIYLNWLKNPDPDIPCPVDPIIVKVIHKAYILDIIKRKIIIKE